MQPEASLALGEAGEVSLITVTVSRKPTRAMYHVSDTTDVAFLVALLAREIRQGKHSAPDAEEKAVSVAVGWERPGPLRAPVRGAESVAPREMGRDRA